MGSLAGDFYLLIGLLGMLAFLLLGTLFFNRNRKVRSLKRRVADRLLNWK